MDALIAQINREIENQDTPTLPQEVMDISQNEKNKSDEEDLRRRLRFFFSSPCQRWKMKERSKYDRVPNKLIVQVLKLVFITIQAVLLGIERSMLSVHIEQSTTAMKSIFLKDYVPPDTLLPVTLDHPDMAIYTTCRLKNMINHAVDQFQNVKNIAFGSFYYSYYDNGTSIPMNMQFKFYKKRKFFPQNLTLFLDPKETTECFFIGEDGLTDRGPSKNDTTNNTGYNITFELGIRNLSQKMDKLLQININFILKNVLLGSLFGISQIHCLKYYTNIVFDNTKRSGKVSVVLTTRISKLHCQQGKFPTNSHNTHITSLATTIIILNLASMLFCSGAIKNSIKLMLVTKRYFKTHLGFTLSKRELFSFIKFWDTLIIANDACTISGTVSIVYSEYQNQDDVSETYNVAIMLLGIGLLLAWLCILRYFAYFPSLYILFLILRKAIVKVFRYMFCVLILYIGFVLCGWLVLGPYHVRFRTFQSSSECLFAVMNGDEVFETFADFSLTYGYLWWFSRIYLYCYIGLFTLIALNLVIAVILDCYDTIKEFVKNGMPKTKVFNFLEGKTPEDTTTNHQIPYFCISQPMMQKDSDLDSTDSLPV